MANPSSLRTPLARVRGLGSARSGTHHFWMMRLTSLALVPLTVAFVWIVVATATRDYASALAYVGHPLVAVLLALSVLVSAYHMMIGMQVVIEDYVHVQGWKFAALMANIFVSVLIGACGLFAILKVAV